MTVSFQTEVSSDENYEYRVEKRFGCSIIWGAIPINDLVNLTKNEDSKVIMSVDLPQKIGAAFVFGTRENLEIMRNHPDLPISNSILLEIEQAKQDGYPDVFLQWLLHGERGRSADAIVQAATGLIKGKKLRNHPHDPSDMGRCLKVVEVLKCDKLSENDILKSMEDVSEVWKNLVSNWSELKKLHAEKSKECYTLITKITSA